MSETAKKRKFKHWAKFVAETPSMVKSGKRVHNNVCIGWAVIRVSLDLHGSVVSEGLIVDRGRARRPEVFGCTDPPIQYDALSLLCLTP